MAAALAAHSTAIAAPSNAVCRMWPCCLQGSVHRILSWHWFPIHSDAHAEGRHSMAAVAQSPALFRPRKRRELRSACECANMCTTGMTAAAIE